MQIEFSPRFLGRIPPAPAEPLQSSRDACDNSKTYGRASTWSLGTRYLVLGSRAEVVVAQGRVLDEDGEEPRADAGAAALLLGPEGAGYRGPRWNVSDTLAGAVCVGNFHVAFV